MRISDQATLALYNRSFVPKKQEPFVQRITCMKHGFTIPFNMCKECVKKCERYYQLSAIYKENDKK